MLEVLPGIGTVTAAPAAAERGRLLRTELDQLVVQAKKLGLNLENVTQTVADH